MREMWKAGPWLLAYFGLLALLVLGCAGDESAGAESEAEAEAESEAEAEGEPCPTFDPATLESCCDVGAAHCAPASAYPSQASKIAPPCGEDGLCIPDEVLTIGEGFSAPPCASIGGEAGACLSLCVPQIMKYADLLPQDVCRKDQRCAPCIDPLTGMESGACLTLTCIGFEGEAEAESEGDYSCENPPTGPAVDPATFPACCEGAHCVPSAVVPAKDAANLSTCEGGYCLPDLFIETQGFFTPATCESIAGVEGRCLSTCLPAIAEQADRLPQAGCAASERCAPCCDPFEGSDTGACTNGCDTGPASTCTGEPAFAPCCDDLSGFCIPAELVPDEQEENLQDCDGGAQCVPEEMLDEGWEGDPCYAYSFVTGEYAGVCLPECLDFGFFGFALDRGDCPDMYMCAPCTDPLTGGSTGAPGC